MTSSKNTPPPPGLSPKPLPATNTRLATAPPALEILNGKQLRVLGFIQEQHSTTGVFPSVREIAAHMDFKSTNTVDYYLRQLIKTGVLQRTERRARTFRVTDLGQQLLSAEKQPNPAPGLLAAALPISENLVQLLPVAAVAQVHDIHPRQPEPEASPSAPHPAPPPAADEDAHAPAALTGASPARAVVHEIDPDYLSLAERRSTQALAAATTTTTEYSLDDGIPLLGQVAAGVPITAEQNYDGMVNFKSYFHCDNSTFALRVKGDSMIDAGIVDGDLVIVRSQERIENGEIGVALIENEATVKRIYDEGSRWRLQPENSHLAPFYIEKESGSFTVAGKVIGVLRKI